MRPYTEGFRPLSKSSPFSDKARTINDFESIRISLASPEKIRSLRRIARFGNGWIPWGDDANDPVGGLARIREALDEVGRDANGFQVSSYLPVQQQGDGSIDLDATMAVVGPMTEAGVTDLRATLQLPEELNAATDLLSPLVEAFRKAAGR